MKMLVSNYSALPGLPRFPLCTILLLVSLFLTFSCEQKPVKSSQPIIEHITRYTATISWQTEAPVKGEVSWYTDENNIQTITEELAGIRHRIPIPGLMPQKVYYYRINSLPDKEFRFKTAPGPDVPFRFCLIGETNISVNRITELYPDFILLAERDSVKLKKLKLRLQSVNSRIPVYRDQLSFEWGNCGFISLFGTREFAATDMAMETILGITDHLDSLRIHKNENQHLVLFVTGADSVHVMKREEAAYVFLSRQSLLVEVQGPEIRAGLIGAPDGDRLPLLLKQTAYSFKKTCVYCRSLLENRQYRKSIEGYKRFISENRETSLHDDALYQIAYIYDHYLFDYKNALKWYRKLVNSYPQSRSVRPAQFRLEYIGRHSDYDFVPLQIFERSRLSSGRDSIAESIQKVEQLLNDYPNTTLRDEILMWLGHVYEKPFPQKAISFLDRLAKSTKNDTMHFRSSLKRADIYYQNKKYGTAEARYRALLKEHPHKRPTLSVKIKRSLRNQWRERIYWAALASVICLALLSGMLRPSGYRFFRYKMILLAGGLYAVAVCVPFFLYYEFLLPLLPFCLFLFPSMLAIAYFIIQTTAKLGVLSPGLRTLTCCCYSLYLTICCLYLLLYHFHFLFIFERLFL
jgi:tetratricopeptide (TPR) repeat protein